MRDTERDPLEAARALASELRQKAGTDLIPDLDKLEALLADAAKPDAAVPEAAPDADMIPRQQLDDLVAENAKFVSVMVHEIRVPMTSIRGYNDMLLKNVVGELNEMQQQFVEVIRSNVIRMEHLVTDVSDASKLRSGRIRPEPKMDMYKNIALEVEKATTTLAEEHGHTLTFDTPQGLPILNVDGPRLVQALTKLVINALQYTPDGGQITVRAENTGGQLKVSVQDSGIGMDDEEQTHIGELFWRGESEHVRSFKGHGLGLPIAIGLVKLMGGEFSYETAPEQGSTFSILLPPMS